MSFNHEEKFGEDHKWEPESWEELLTYLLDGRTRWCCIFRGLSRAKYDNRSSLRRSVADHYQLSQRIHNAESEAFDQFIRSAPQWLESPPPVEDITSWLMLMQHYGAPTRLIDWTLSPFVALYFAFRQPRSAYEPDLDEPAALWMLHELKCRFHYGEFEPGDFSIWNNQSVGYHYSVNEVNERVLKAIRAHSGVPFVLSPRIPDQRMLNQKGILTLCTNSDATIPFPLEIPFKKGFKTNDKRPALCQIRVNWGWRNTILSALDLMGINDASMFPGLDGIGKYTAYRLNSKWNRKSKYL